MVDGNIVYRPVSAVDARMPENQKHNRYYKPSSRLICHASKRFFSASYKNH